MSDFHEYSTEIVFVSDSVNAHFGAQLTERVYARDRIASATFGVRSSDTVQVSDALKGNPGTRLSDYVRVKDSLSGVSNTTAQLSDRVRVRDTTQEIRGARLSDSVTAGDETRCAIGVRSSDSIRLTDATQVGIGAQVRERMRAKDQARSYATGRVADSVHLQEALGGLTVRLSERIEVYDSPAPVIRSRLKDGAKARDQIRGRLTGARTVEIARVKATARPALVARLQDSVVVADQVQALRAIAVRMHDSLRVIDSLMGQSLVLGRAAERVLANDGAWGLYSATAHSADSIYVQDLLPTPPKQGRAWTACADGWPMSRYENYPFASVAVLDGMAYGASPDGVFALKGGDEVINGQITTGRIDVGQGVLSHPLGAYLEYELSDGGQASMSVTQTQWGDAAQTWSYPLEQEPAEYLTNGRFHFGRGLRGRHFAFRLDLQGTHAHINDLYVVADATKRRV